MRNTLHISTLISLVFLLIFGLYPSRSEGALLVQAHIVSGRIIHKYKDHAVRLDNGKLYQPSREGLIVNARVGSPVTLGYVIEDGNKNVFFEYARGLHSLQQSQAKRIRNNNIPR